MSDQPFQSRVRQAISDRRLNQDQCAKLIGINSGTLSRFLSGKQASPFSPGTLNKITAWLEDDNHAFAPSTPTPRMLLVVAAADAVAEMYAENLSALNYHGALVIPSGSQSPRPLRKGDAVLAIAEPHPESASVYVRTAKPLLQVYGAITMGIPTALAIPKLGRQMCEHGDLGEWTRQLVHDSRCTIFELPEDSEGAETALLENVGPWCFENLVDAFLGLGSTSREGTR
jgi:transcriptional regulator with XRE-family HTH domain